MSMITADRVAYHDIAIVTVAKDYVCLEYPTPNMFENVIFFPLRSYVRSNTADQVVHEYCFHCSLGLCLML